MAMTTAFDSSRMWRSQVLKRRSSFVMPPKPRRPARALRDQVLADRAALVQVAHEPFLRISSKRTSSDSTSALPFGFRNGSPRSSNTSAASSSTVISAS